MKKLLIGLLVTVSSVGAHAFYTKCDSDTYDFNVMTVSESEESINFELSGSTIFNLTNERETAYTRSSFKVDKSKCVFSEDKRLLLCDDIDEVVVTRTERHYSKDGPYDKTTYVTVRDLALEISYGESYYNPTFFELVSEYKIEDSKDLTVNDELFPGDKETGCKYTRD